jgi:hypothetical protein
MQQYLPKEGLVNQTIAADGEKTCHHSLALI